MFGVLRRPVESALASAVHVMNAARRRFSVIDGRMQRCQCQRCIQASRQRVTHNLATAGVENDSKVAETSGDADVREVGHPDHIGPRRDHIAIKVRVDRRIVVAIRRANIPLARLDPEAIGPHDAGDTLVIDEVASSLKLVCYASVSIARQLVLDVLYDCNEFAVAET